MARSFKYEKKVSPIAAEAFPVAQEEFDPSFAVSDPGDVKEDGEDTRIVSADEADKQLQSNPLGIPSIYEDEQKRLNPGEDSEPSNPAEGSAKADLDPVAAQVADPVADPVAAQVADPVADPVADSTQVAAQVADPVADEAKEGLTEEDIKNALEGDKKSGGSKSGAKSTKSTKKK